MSIDRGSPDDLKRDFNLTREGTFGVDLPNGEYFVTIVVGDARGRRDKVEISLEGSKVDGVSTRAAQFKTRTYRVAVADGQLNLRLRDRGGSNRHAAINALEIAPVDPNSQRFDFGPAASPVAAGFTPVNETTVFDAAQGFGWQAGVIQSLDRGGPDDLRRDFNVTESGTFAVDLANGTYFVSLTMGDADRKRDLMEVFLEGTKVASVTAKRGEFVTRIFQVVVTDGQLTLGIADEGGDTRNAVINGLEITASS
jgi:fibronectin type 3 domain-containing protein